MQALSEVFERYVKKPYYRGNHQPAGDPYRGATMLFRCSGSHSSKLEEESFPILSYDASLGGNYLVICVVLFNLTNGTCFASFDVNPNFGVALERTVTELLQKDTA